jgi:hypothetical protein
MSSEEQSDHPSAAFFKSIPWCASRLSSHPSLKLWNPPWMRIPNKFGDQMFSDTLNTASTIPHLLLFYSKPEGPKDIVYELCCFMALEKGVGGFPGYVHGGAISMQFSELLFLFFCAPFRSVSGSRQFCFLSNQTK